MAVSLVNSALFLAIIALTSPELLQAVPDPPEVEEARPSAATTSSDAGDEVRTVPATTEEQTAEKAALRRAQRAALRRAIRRAPYRALLRKVYDDLGGTPLFFEGMTPTAEANELMALVEDLPSHGINRGPYKLGFEPYRPQRCRGSRARRPRCRSLMRSSPFTLQTATNLRKMAEMDVRLTAAALRYVLDFRVLYATHPVLTRRRAEIQVRRQSSEVVATVKGLFPDVDTQLRSLWPKNPQYPLIRRTLQEYRDRLASGTRAPRLTRRDVRRVEFGTDGPRVLKIQQRLVYEGYLADPPSGVFDAATMDAVRTYQRTHQLTETGTVRGRTRHRLNIPIWKRARQLRLALQRLRESSSERRDLENYIRVNIPNYELTVFQNRLPTQRHRVIVGNNNLEYNRAGWTQGYLNRSPVLDTHIAKIILHPVWIVPERIRDQEYDGVDRLVKAAGPDNPLGEIKFVLSRTGGVFLHDTNQRRKFDNTRRAYSHGCIRVQNAVELGEALTVASGSVSSDEYRSMHSAGTQSTRVPINGEFTVIFEYNTVDVNEQGEVVFLPDVYDYDEAVFDERLPVTNHVRYGHRRMRPQSVPLISDADYQMLRSRGSQAPLEWPPAGTAGLEETLDQLDATGADLTQDDVQ